MVSRHQVARRRLAPPILSLLRTRRPFRLFVVVLLILYILKSLPKAVVDRFKKDSGLEEPTTEAPPAFPQGQQQYLPYKQPTAAASKSSPILENHRFRADGLVEVNEDGAHPIYELISRAEHEWEIKLKRASKTLAQAVNEYRRRYKRHPPKGFDLWWKYAVENNVQLPDEYDQIYNDLEPFWGIEPSDLIQIQKEGELKQDTYTIGKNSEGEVGVLTHMFRDGTYDQFIAGSRAVVDLFKPIQEYLPSFRMTLWPDDRPNLLTDYGVETAAREAADSETYIARSKLPRIAATGWKFACSPNSPARRRPFILDKPPPSPKNKTFIWNHPLTMDPCNHPSHFFHHGQFLSHGLGPAPQPVFSPEFAYCSTTLHHNIRLPVPYDWVEDVYPRAADPEWDEKVDERLLWRGSNTGMYHSKTSRWRHSHRIFLVEHANELQGTLKVLSPNKTRHEKVGEPLEVRKARINPAVMDIAFGGQPLACSDEVCNVLEEIYPWRKWQSFKEAGRYKYVLDVDGNGWSGRFKRLITSNAMVFKSTIYPEWYADRIAPWVHYVPVQVDLSDLHDALLFFRGDGNGEGAHEHLARKIALSGRQWSKTFWRKEDLVSYMFRLTLEYARLMSVDREAMTYHH